MMVDAGIGRLLVASLHQGIADVAPARLPFYETWLTAPGLQHGKVGLAQLHAALSFLRREGRIPYERIMTRAGQYGADWEFIELRGFERGVVRRLPQTLRARAAMTFGRRLVEKTFRGSRARVRLRRTTGTMDIRASVFCEVRETAGWPMCVFYAAALERLLQCFELDATVDVSQCKASGDSGCTMAVTIHGQAAAPSNAHAA